MVVWRPPEEIRVKALGIPWRGDFFLASEITHDNGRVKGVRPMGGTVEFGEAWQDCLKREFMEEIGAEITLFGQPHTFENIYSHHGVTGHEIVFLSNIRFVDTTFYDHNEILFCEDDGFRWTARWFNLGELKTKGPELFPTGLLDRLLAGPETHEFKS